MIPNTAVRVVSSSPITESAEFGISTNDTAHIMSILRDQLYSDKILAVLREYGSNAWDAHRDAGKPELPIKVTLPTGTDPTLYIRDFGLGLTPAGVFKVFTQYGASTKRNSDNAVGMLGIGSKSGFAYSDSFTVTSFCGGVKRTYVAVLDVSEKGLINLLHEEPCGEETGVQISIAVRPEDLRDFERKAHEVFKYFVPRPEINTTLPPLPPAQVALKHGVIYQDDIETHDRQWVAVMGCVSYNINLEQLRGIDATAEGGIASFLGDISGALYFNIGDVQVSASREELKYRSETKVALIRKFTELVDEFVQRALDDILLKTNSPWERRVKAQTLAKLHLPVPDTASSLLVGKIAIKDKVPKGLIVTQGRSHVTSITVDERTRFIIVDDSRKFSGYSGLHYTDYFIRALDKAGHFRTAHVQWAPLELGIAEMLKAVDIDGVPVLKLSSFPWAHHPRYGSDKPANSKHSKRVFKFLPEHSFCRPWSDSWEPVTTDLTPNDLFVVIESFQTKNYDISSYVRADLMLAEQFGGVVPPIYGYKSTTKKPVQEKDCVGTPYLAWRDKWIQSLLTPQVKDQLALLSWVKLGDDSGYGGRYRKIRDWTAPQMVSALGPDHQISLALLKATEAKKFFEKNYDLSRALTALASRTGVSSSSGEAQVALTAITTKYPLIAAQDFSFADTWGNNSDAWIQYIKLIDKG